MKCPFCIKICTKCGELLVAYNGNFNKNKTSKSGLNSKCKKCVREQSKKRYEENREEKLDKCKKYRDTHKEEIKEYMEQYSQNNKEKIKERNKKYTENNKEKIKKYHKNYYEEHKDDIKERQKKYHKNNPEVAFNKRNKRRLKEENQGSGISKEQWIDMVEFFDWKCAYSGEYLGNKNNYDRTIDHIIPIDKNGEHEIWNCVPMIRNYNSSKQDKDMLEWYIQQDFYLEERLNKIYEWIEYAKNKYQK